MKVQEIEIHKVNLMKLIHRIVLDVRLKGIFSALLTGILVPVSTLKFSNLFF